MPEPIIRLDGLSKKFGKKTVLDNIKLNIPQGSFYGLIGLSGSGKTTLMNILVGFWKQSSGKVYFQGKDLKKYKNTIKQMFGFATQAGSVYEKLTVAENMNYFGRLYNMGGKDIQEQSSRLLRMVDMVGIEDVPTEDLSTGMRRRLDIACALIHSPKILILDEPTEDLDPVLRKEVLALLKHINDQGTTIIMASHLLYEAEEICDSMAILHKGNILDAGSPMKLKEKYSKRNEIHIKLKSGKYEEYGKKLKKQKMGEVIVKKSKIVIYTNKAPEILHKVMGLAKEGDVTEIDYTKPSLEEVFEVMTKK